MLVIVARLLHLRDVRSDGVLQEVPEILYAESHEKLLGALQHAVVFCFFDECVANVEMHKSPQRTGIPCIGGVMVLVGGYCHAR